MGGGRGRELGSSSLIVFNLQARAQWWGGAGTQVSPCCRGQKTPLGASSPEGHLWAQAAGPQSRSSGQQFTPCFPGGSMPGGGEGAAGSRLAFSRSAK